MNTRSLIIGVLLGICVGVLAGVSLQELRQEGTEACQCQNGGTCQCKLTCYCERYSGVTWQSETRGIWNAMRDATRRLQAHVDNLDKRLSKVEEGRPTAEINDLNVAVNELSERLKLLEQRAAAKPPVVSRPAILYRGTLVE